MDEITISLEEYKKLLSDRIRMEIFIDWLKSQTYITKEECVILLGLESEEKNND